jgi:hypothetical protein
MAISTGPADAGPPPHPRQLAHGLFHLYELADPSAPTLPRFVGYGQTRPGWRHLWERRWELENRAGEWLRGLKEPPPRTYYSFGEVTPRPLWMIESLFRCRVEALRGIGAGDYLLNDPPTTPQPIKRHLPDGTFQYFRSLGDAGRALGIHRRTIRRHVAAGTLDAEGGYWSQVRIF